MKLCMNCKHYDVNVVDLPCVNCIDEFDNPNWEAKFKEECKVDSKFKVGNLIRVVDTGDTCFIQDMNRYCGKEVTICKIYGDGDYRILEDEMDWYWINEFFEPINTLDEFDIVNKPKHYADKEIEVIDYIKDTLSPEGFQDYCIGNVIKYVSRYKLKNGVEDLKKARYYLNKTIEFLEKK